MPKHEEKPKQPIHKKIGTKKEPKEIHHPPKHDELGNVIEEAYTETVMVDVDVYGTVYVELTDKEIEEQERLKNLPIPKSLEERISDLEKAFEELKALLNDKPKPKP